tara:strand:+ start:245 stop:514 length:270 start_codon:yes stop_codon:yes gene_type:complete
MNKQVNFTTVMDYRQTFTVDIDFEELKKELVEKYDYDDEEVQGTWESDDEMYNLAWEMVMENPDKYRDQALGEGDFDNEIVYNDNIINS